MRFNCVLNNVFIISKNSNKGSNGKEYYSFKAEVNNEIIEVSCGLSTFKALEKHTELKSLKCKYLSGLSKDGRHYEILAVEE